MRKTITASIAAAALAGTLMGAAGLQAAPEKPPAEDVPAEHHRRMMSGASMGMPDMMEQMSRMMENCNKMMEAKHSPDDEKREHAPG